MAAAIESSAAADLSPYYSELAHHYANATTAASERALVYARLAAEQATSRLAYDEAVLQWRAAPSALDRSGGAPPAVRARLLLELAAAERSAGNLAAGSAVNDEALAVARRTNDSVLMADAALAFGEVGLWQVSRYGTVDEHVVDVIERTSPVSGTMIRSSGCGSSPGSPSPCTTGMTNVSGDWRWSVMLLRWLGDSMSRASLRRASWNSW